MNKTACAIICEYDPFHTGHKYQIEQARLLSGCDCIVCIMSGSVTQRASLPIADKYTRASFALQNGADMVLQLPAIFSCANAQYFAQGAVKLLSQLDFVSHLAFGIESDNCIELDKVALLLDDANFGKELAKQSKNGLSYPTTIQQALHSFDSTNFDTNTTPKPNTILAIEYIRALHKYCTRIIPLAIKRTNDHNSQNTNTQYASSSAIRTQILNGMPHAVQQFLPYPVQQLYQNKDDSAYSAILMSRLKNTTPQNLKNILSTTEGLEHRLTKASSLYSELEKTIQYTKSKRYIYSKIKRIILQNYLGITKSLTNDALQHDTNIPFRVLGVKDTATQLLSQLPNHAIKTNADAKKLQLDPTAPQHISNKAIIDIDIKADILYTVCARLNGDLYFDKKMLKVSCNNPSHKN